MIHKSKAIPIRLSIKAYEAYLFLEDKPINRSKLICDYVEKGLIEYAEKYKRPKLIKVKLPF